MNCQKIQDCFGEYSAGVLREREARTVEEHVGRCPDCAREWRAFEEMLAMVEAMPRAEPTAGLWSRVEAALEREIALPWWSLRRIGLPQTALRRSLAAGAVAAVAAWAMLSGPGKQRSAPMAPDLSPYLEQHLVMSQDAPFADRAGTGAILAITYRKGS
ncbi:MAG: hypothetical protein IT210_09440 [Armatimonadetes bacterium]|nr:hypothetical protein [Armatimonadota bacterium]